MNQTPFIVPASATPGAELTPEARKTPSGVTYFRVYMGAVALLDATAMVMGFWLVFAPFASTTGLPPDIANLFSGLFWVFVAGLHLIGTLIALLGGRKAWVHTLGLVLVVLSIPICCCTPLGIPVLIAYNGADVKAYYDE